MNTSASRCEEPSHQRKYPPKRTRSFVLKRMLEELRSVKRESRAAMNEIATTTVKSEPGLENEDIAANVEGVYICEKSVERTAKGKQTIRRVAGGAGDKSYHAAVYRAYIQPRESRRCNVRKTDAAKQKSKAVGVNHNDDGGRRCDAINGSRRENATGVVIGEYTGQRRENHVEKEKVDVLDVGVGRCIRRDHVYLPEYPPTNRAGMSESSQLKAKGKAVEVTDDTARLRKKLNDKGHHFGSVLDKNQEEIWNKVVENPKKLRDFVLQIPAAFIHACMSGGSRPICLLDCEKGVPYYCDLRKRKDDIKRFLCGAWSDFCKDRDINKGDALHFRIKYPPVDEIMVMVQHARAK